MNTGLIISRLFEAPAPAEEALARAPVDTSSPGEGDPRSSFNAALHMATLLVDERASVGGVAQQLNATLGTKLAESFEPSEGTPERLLQVAESFEPEGATAERLAQLSRPVEPAVAPLETPAQLGESLQPGGTRPVVQLEPPVSDPERQVQFRETPDPNAAQPAELEDFGASERGQTVPPHSPAPPVNAFAASGRSLESSGGPHDTIHVPDSPEASPSPLPAPAIAPETLDVSAELTTNREEPTSPLPPDIAHEGAAEGTAVTNAPPQALGDSPATPTSPARPDPPLQGRTATDPREAPMDTVGRASRIELSAPTPDSTTEERADPERPGYEPPQSQAAVRELAGGALSRGVEEPNSQPIQGGQGAASSALNEAREPVPARDHRPLPELPAQNETEIIREARLLVRNGGGQARIQLHPVQLGELSVQVTVTDRAVTVNLIAEHAQIADLLARHLPELRQALEGAGIRMEELDVNARSAADDRDELESRGFAGHGEARDYGTSRRSGLLEADLPEVRPLPLVSLNTLGTVDVTI